MPPPATMKGLSSVPGAPSHEAEFETAVDRGDQHIPLADHPVPLGPARADDVARSADRADDALERERAGELQAVAAPEPEAAGGPEAEAARGGAEVSCEGSDLLTLFDEAVCGRDRLSRGPVRHRENRREQRSEQTRKRSTHRGEALLSEDGKV
jgi:hypothetical protein